MADLKAPTVSAAPTTIAELSSAFPELVASIRSEAGSAERARIAGIEAHAMPGHEALIAVMKADGNITPDIAAGRILAAEKAARGSQLQAIKDVETLTSKVTAAPSSQPAAPSPEKATSPDGWKAEFAASAELRAEFGGDEEAYVGFKAAEQSGKVRRLTQKSA